MSNIKDRVSFDISKLLKDKGFKELVNYFYSPDGNLMPKVLESGNEPMRFAPDDFYENFNGIVEQGTHSKRWTVFSAPTFAQVVDWFREKHNVIISAQPRGKEFTGVREYFISGYWRHNPTDKFKTYYEALNKAIEEAIKLI